MLGNSHYDHGGIWRLYASECLGAGVGDAINSSWFWNLSYP